MLEAAVGDSLKKLGLEHELLEPSSVNANISLFLLPALDSGGLSLLDLLLLAVNYQNRERGQNLAWRISGARECNSLI